jgi:hypothetical protein
MDPEHWFEELNVLPGELEASGAIKSFQKDLRYLFQLLKY